MLAWDEPSYRGERPDEPLSYRIECLGCASLVKFFPAAVDILERRVTITELYPGRSYNFTIFAENNVSAIASDVTNFQVVNVTTQNGCEFAS